MFSKVLIFVKNNIVFTIGCLIWGFCVYKVVDNYINPPELGEFKGSIQNHLVWSISGDCYFVRPTNNSTVYLVQLPDCSRNK